MADKEEGTSTTGDNPPMKVEQGPLVSVTFQKNPTRKQKYLEAQPKELGITQICLGLYQLSWLTAMFSLKFAGGETVLRVLFLIANAVVIVAGILAIAAKTLHIITLRACFAMQILAVAASAFAMILMLGQFENHQIRGCWIHYDESNGTSSQHILCEQMDHALHHLQAGVTLVQAVLVALSITLAAYCCKVINCCSQGSRMPVITVQAPTNPPAPE